MKDPLNLILYNHDDLFRTITYHVVGIVKDSTTTPCMTRSIRFSW